MTYEDYSRGSEVYAHTKYHVNLTCHFWYSKLVIFGILGIPGHNSQKWQYQLMENLTFTCTQKSNFILNFFLQISQSYCKFVWVLTACLTKPTKKDFNLQRTLMFIGMQKPMTSFPKFFFGKMATLLTFTYLEITYPKCAIPFHYYKPI